MEIVNYVYRGNLQEQLHLPNLLASIRHPDVQLIRHQTKQPEQLIIKFKNSNTLMFFKSGAFRMMGKCDDITTHLNIYEIINQFSSQIPEITLQTMTACYNYHRKIHLTAMAVEDGMQYTAEFFPAIQNRVFPGIHINIFSTGKITITGIKDEVILETIKTYLDSIVLRYLL